MSLAHRGDRAEREVWQRLSQKALVVLASPLTLRKRGLAQLDLCYILRGHLVVVEVKTSRPPAPRQRRRLLNTAHQLGLIFGLPSRLEVEMAEASFF